MVSDEQDWGCRSGLWSMDAVVAMSVRHQVER